jgi:NAD(P)H-dependent flavin oxidoreductase YrpB (nitropropane dioxygenase family)
VPHERARFTELVGCRWPIQLAAMGGAVGGPDLAAAVREGGGLGMVSWGEEIPHGCGVNILMPFMPPLEQVADAARRARLVEFFYDDPDPELVAVVHASGALAGWQVGSAREAGAAEAAGCDYLVVQGVEAGGHVRGTSPLDAVLREVLPREGVPVLAAGGIATAERVADLMEMGASGVRVGTRFLTCPESNAHEDYVANLLAATSDDTELTEWFGDGWPGAPHRVLRGSLELARASGCRNPGPPTRAEAGPVDDRAQYAGTGVGDVTTSQRAADVVADLVRLLPPASS